MDPSIPDVSKPEFLVKTNSLYIRALRDPYGGLQNPYFLELQQKNVAAGENCPYVRQSEGLKYEIAHYIRNLDGKNLKRLETFNYEKDFKKK